MNHLSNGRVLIFALVCFLALSCYLTRRQRKASLQNQYPFQNPELPIEQRIDNILSLMTIDEKIECLDTNPSVPRLGIKGVASR